MSYDPREQTSILKDYFLPGAILLSGILISVVIFWSKTYTKDALPSAILPIDISQNERVQIKINPSDPALGSPNAPITIVEFYDFQCGYCRLFAQETVPKIINKYVKSGDVRFIFKDFAILGDDSKTSAVAANCASEQNKFLEYYNALYSAQNEGKTLSQETLLSLSQSLNLNTIKFNNCIGLSKNKDAVNQDTNEGKLAGVTGTPTLFINGLKVSGAQSFATISAIIEQELTQ